MPVGARSRSTGRSCRSSARGRRRPRRSTAAVDAAARADVAAGHVAAARAVSRRRRPVSARRRAEGRVHAVRAALLYGSGDLRVEELPRPEPGPGDVLVQVELALTDGTDLKTYRRGHPLLAREFARRRSGTSSAASSTAGASSRRTRRPAWRCDGCARGEQCRELVFLAGAYAEWIVVPERIAAVNLHRRPARRSRRRSRRWSSRSRAALRGDRACGHRGRRSRSRSSGPVRSA